MDDPNHALHRCGALLAAVAAGCFAAAVGAQQPTGNMARPQPAAQQPGNANDPAGNQSANPAGEGDTGATRSRTPAAATTPALTLDRFNGLDKDKDGALSAAELGEDPALADRFDDMDTDRNREIDDVEFMSSPAPGEAAGG